MKTSITSLFFLLFVGAVAWCQIPNKNAVIIRKARISTTNPATLSGNIQNALTTIHYSDGLGRPLQTLGYRQSASQKDLILETSEYDASGRPFKAFLAIPTTDNSGYFQTNVQASGSIFYGDNAPFNEVKSFDNSPLNRVLEEYGAGQAWHTASKYRQKSPKINTAADAVRLYRVNGSSVSSNQNYAAGTLYKDIQIDEQGGSTISFSNLQGQLIEKWVLEDGGNYLKTAYVYNDMDRLSYIIQPEGFSSALSFNESSSVFTQFIFAYQYDDRGRVIKKHLPDGGWTNIVYDFLDRPVLQQNPQQAASNKWSFTKYDVQGRIAIQGELSNSSDRNTLQTAFNGVTNPYENYINGVEAYSNQSFPIPYSINDAVLVNYYDVYDWIPGELAFDAGSSFDAASHWADAKGLPTGSWARSTENTGTGFHTVLYYDNKGRVLQTQRTHHRGSPTKRISTDYQYSFSGELLKEKTVHRFNSLPDVSRLLTHNYDHTGRLWDTKLKINNGTEQKIAEYEYDEIGRLRKKTLMPEGTYTQDMASNYLRKRFDGGTSKGPEANSNGDGAPDGAGDTPSDLESGRQGALSGLPDLSPSISMSGGNYYPPDGNSYHSKNVVISIINVGSGPTTAPVEFYIPVVESIFEMSFDGGFSGLVSTGSAFGPFEADNTIWDTQLNNGGYRRYFTLKPGHVIGAGQMARLKLKFTAVGNPGSSGSVGVYITGGTGGGETPNTNNSTYYSTAINLSGSNPGSSTTIAGLQQIQYSYHIRGGLLGINLDSNGSPAPQSSEGDLFAYKLDYETAGQWDGNIGKQAWKTIEKTGINRSYSYTYDAAKRLKTASFAGNNDEDFSLPEISYDKNGNILNMQRNGKLGASSFGLMDHLTYTYSGNKLTSVTDAVNGDHEVDLVPRGGGGYTYWLDGSLKSDANEQIGQIDYNTFLGQPKLVTLTGGQWIKHFYDGTGTLLKTQYSTGETWEYIGELVLKNGQFYQMATPEGRAIHQSGNWAYEFDYKDHLGNTRVSFRANGSQLEKTAETHFDPWGLRLAGTGTVNAVQNRWEMQGHEKEETFGLNRINFGARTFNATIGRFDRVDMYSEKYYSLSTFQYSNNNPNRFIDPDGRMAVPFDDPLKKMKVRENRASNLMGMVRNGGSRAHQGWDLEAAIGTPTYAVKGGTVSLVETGAYGKQVILTFEDENGNTKYAQYAHLSAYNVTNGQKVEEGQLLGETGDTGNAKGVTPHLHFEIRNQKTVGLGLGGRENPNSTTDTKFYSQNPEGNQTQTGVLRVNPDGSTTQMNLNGSTSTTPAPLPQPTQSNLIPIPNMTMPVDNTRVNNQ
ncbi:peptidoglycan DD-metalloendopeptidase family protein [Marinilongibacter aquaticus]|uniref:DUF6443 domain-containing protein n=1 Tax=Marinilongibacter aquaticus TaxID=2975157 RepID=UPI0021BD1A83|nr:DUF6443 domain-containing protein [Marinilongibacter aquaticus]UBM59516.1 peptidoglycan DD-metalloendopeptidase family protein [Marinilongibacter aquaticus]